MILFGRAGYFLSSGLDNNENDDEVHVMVT